MLFLRDVIDRFIMRMSVFQEWKQWTFLYPFTCIYEYKYFCRLLQCLDKGTLRLLSENTRIQQFSPNLCDWLSSIVESKNQQVCWSKYDLWFVTESYFCNLQMQFLFKLSEQSLHICTNFILQVGPVFPKSPIGSVSFQAETDNRKNFPDDRTFHLFKRQRYCFFEWWMS